MFSVWSFTFGLVLFSAAFSVAQSHGNCPNVEKGVDYYGHDIGHGSASSVDACCDMCSSDPACKHFTFKGWQKICYKKSSKAGKTRKRGSQSGSPSKPPPPPHKDPCAKTYDQTMKAGTCHSPNKCVDDSHVGKWSVYAVPCDDKDKDELYNMDPGWGGAHITMTSFQAMSHSEASGMFNNVKDSLDPVKSWHPTTFKAKSETNGVRKIDIASKNLDMMSDIMKNAGWHSPTKKGNWHVTMTDLTGKSFHQGDHNFDQRTSLFSNHHWALVLVHCFKDADGKITFHRQNGYTLMEWAHSTSGLHTLVV